jgi:hypothetical protein
MSTSNELPEPVVIRHCVDGKCKTAVVPGAPAKRGEMAARPVPGGWQVKRADARRGWRRCIVDDDTQEQHR